MRIVDLRSDTVTHPTPEMREAMATAELGDDVYGDDPTVNRFEALAAKTFGMEDAVFVASGTMGNLVSVLTHCQRGDELIVGDMGHIFQAEAAGASVLGGVSIRTVPNDSRGMIDPDDVEAAIRPDNIHYPPTRMIGLENTQNLCGGKVLTPEDTATIAEVAMRHEIPLHVDGARIFNAAVYLETPVAELVKNVDTVSVCLSKGLSCPVGSVVCGSRETIEGARRWRKILGGGMRQLGVLAAAGIVAFETMVERLAEDHANAKKLAKGLEGIPGISIDSEEIETNLVFFEVTGDRPAELAQAVEKRGVKGYAPGRRWRFTTHYGITSGDIDHTLDVMDSTFRERANSN